MYKTIRKNATKKIAAILATCPLIRVFHYDDMGDTTGKVTAEQVLECGREYEFDRVYESDDTITLAIHQNWVFTGYKSLDAARRHLTPECHARYGL